jgi:DNA (cytosine-5)-methyltransferase 1
VLTHGSYFTGIGLLDLGLCLAGLDEPEWVCELDDWRRDAILARRFPRAVRHETFETPEPTTSPASTSSPAASPAREQAPGKRNGFDHPETVLWREMARAVGELRPRYVVVENVANILALHDGAVWGEVLGDLAALGYDVVWDCLPAAAVGAPHLRDRVFAVATYADGQPVRQQPEPEREGGRTAGSLDGDGAPPADATIVAQREPADEGDALAGSGEARLEPPRRWCSFSRLRWPAMGRAAVRARRRTHARPIRRAATSPTSASRLAEYGPAIRRWEQGLKRVRLNPSFVEWMIGAPDGWSDPDCPLSATEFRSRSAKVGRSPSSVRRH